MAGGGGGGGVLNGRGGGGGGGGYIKWNGAVSWLVRFVCNVNFTAPYSLWTLRN